MYFLSISSILEIENRCIFAALPFLFMDKRKGAQIAAQSFWLRAKVGNRVYVVLINLCVNCTLSEAIFLNILNYYV